MTDPAPATIDPTRLHNLFASCLYTEAEIEAAGGHDAVAEVAVVAAGVMMTAGFHPDRIAAARDEVTSMLRLLPDPFFAAEHGGGGGWSFLNACTDRNEVLWTGSHQSVDELLILGVACGLVEIPLPREVWPVLPGGVPYFTITFDPKEGA